MTEMTFHMDAYVSQILHLPILWVDVCHDQSMWLQRNSKKDRTSYGLLLSVRQMTGPATARFVKANVCCDTCFPSSLAFMPQVSDMALESLAETHGFQRCCSAL